MELENNKEDNSSNNLKNYNLPSIYTKNTIIEKKKYSSSDDIEKFLNDEKNLLKEEPWSRLQHKEKLEKLNIFSETYCKNNNIIDKKSQLDNFLSDLFRRRTKKEVLYNKKDGIIENIQGLVYNRETDEFQMLKQTNRVSTLKGLPKSSYSRKKKDKKNITKKNNDI